MRKGGGRTVPRGGALAFRPGPRRAGGHVFCGKMGRGKGQWREDRISLRRAKTRRLGKNLRRLGKFFPRFGVFFRRLGKNFRCLPVFPSSRQSVRSVAGGGEAEAGKRLFLFCRTKIRAPKKAGFPTPCGAAEAGQADLIQSFFTYYLLFVYGVVGGLFVARTAHKYQYVINQCSQRAEGSHYVSVGG